MLFVVAIQVVDGAQGTAMGALRRLQGHPHADAVRTALPIGAWGCRWRLCWGLDCSACPALGVYGFWSGTIMSLTLAAVALIARFRWLSCRPDRIRQLARTLAPMLWVWLTLGAAFVQNVRSLLQRQLSAAGTGPLTILGATYVRFLYAVPFAWLGAALLFADRPVPDAGPAFWLSSGLGGVAQIAGTAALLGSFRRRSFAVGTAFSKTEAMQTAAFGLVLLGDSLSWLAFAGILISLIGVVVMTVKKSPEDRVRWQGGVGLGLLAGAAFAAAAVCYRGAALSLPDGTILERAVATLAVALTVQTAAMGPSAAPCGNLAP